MTDRQDAAESLAQNNPCGLEKEAIKADSGAALAPLRFNVQNDSFQARIILNNAVEAKPGAASGSRKENISFHTDTPSILAASMIS